MRPVVALAGGVGGARLAHGLAGIEDVALSVVVNTGDDFEHLGLTICPDLDTVLYTLAGRANRAQGWGLEAESWAFLDQIGQLGGPDWFRLGDRDLALHVLRTQRLRDGARLTEVMADFAQRLGLRAALLPMADEPVRTLVDAAGGELPFQDYFVRLRCEPPVRGFRFAGIAAARLTPEVKAALAAADLAAVVVCPSNPFVSVAPVLAVPGLRAAIVAAGAPVVAVSPIIGGAAVKGPAAKMLGELGLEVSALGVACGYIGFADGFVLDTADRDLAPAIEALGLRTMVTDALMRDEADRVRLAGECLAFAAALPRRPR